MTFIETTQGLIVLIIITILWAVIVLALGTALIGEGVAWLHEQLVKGGEEDEAL
jgi:hypothetical protein